MWFFLHLFKKFVGSCCEKIFKWFVVDNTLTIPYMYENHFFRSVFFHSFYFHSFYYDYIIFPVEFLSVCAIFFLTSYFKVNSKKKLCELVFFCRIEWLDTFTITLKPLASTEIHTWKLQSHWTDVKILWKKVASEYLWDFILHSIYTLFWNWK